MEINISDLPENPFGDVFRILSNIKICCDEQDGSCRRCPYCTNRDDDYRCMIQSITGTYPDSWKGGKKHEGNN